MHPVVTGCIGFQSCSPTSRVAQQKGLPLVTKVNTRKITYFLLEIQAGASPPAVLSTCKESAGRGGHCWGTNSLRESHPSVQDSEIWKSHSFIHWLYKYTEHLLHTRHCPRQGRGQGMRQIKPLPSGSLHSNGKVVCSQCQGGAVLWGQCFPRLGAGSRADAGASRPVRACDFTLFTAKTLIHRVIPNSSSPSWI